MTESKDIGRAFLSRAELASAGFSEVGKNVRVSRKCSLYSIRGRIGDHVRIDDFCILKGHVEIGNHVHICAFCSLSGTRGIVHLESFSTLANRVSVYTGSDDYRADGLSSSTVPEKYLATIAGDISIGRAALIGAHSILLPGTKIGEAASVGALCIVRGIVPPGSIVTSGKSELVFKGMRNIEQIARFAQEVEQNES